MLLQILHRLDIDNDDVKRIRVSPELFKKSVQVEEAPDGETNLSHRGVPISIDSSLDVFEIRLDSPVTSVETTVSVSSA